MIKLIASDLDGTLLSGHDQVHPENVKALQAAMARGVHFAVASGRSVSSCSILMRAHGLDEVTIIGVNGCQVMDRPFGKIIVEHQLRQDAAREAMRVFDAYGLGACLYTRDALVYSTQRILEVCEGGRQKTTSHEQMDGAGTRILSGPEAVQQALEGTPLKAFCIVDHGQEEAFAAAREACARIPGISITSSWINNFEVMPEGVDKGTALRELAEHLGIKRDEVMAFGDSENDVEMLRWAGHSYAMENAQPEVKEAAANCTGHCTEGGVGMAIWKHLKADGEVVL